MLVLLLEVIIMNKNKKVSKVLLTFISIFSLLVGFCAGVILKTYQNKPISDTIISGDLKIHFMELGNIYTGDSILIQIGEYDILVDAGSTKDSITTIKNYLDQHINDNTLEYVIATHADSDHIAGFAGDGNTSLFSHYKTENIIQFSKTDKDTKTYQNYLTMVEKEVNEGAKLYTALECYNNENGCNRIIDLGFGVELEILYNYYYENNSTDENNYSVCFIINQGDNHFLFTGDLEKEGEEKLVELNSLPKVTMYKAGHHGSKTSSTLTLLNVIQPEIVIIPCVAGTHQYTQIKDSTFPTFDALTNISKFTDKVYIPAYVISEYIDGEYKDVDHSSLNGNIIISSNKDGVTVTGSNNSTILKDSEWYKTNRNNIELWK